MARFQPGRCSYCGKPFQKAQTLRGGALKALNPTLDHVYPQTIPVPCGLDWNTAKNRVRACHKCNNAKGNLHPIQWLTTLSSDVCAMELARLLIELGEGPFLVGIAYGRRRNEK